MPWVFWARAAGVAWGVAAPPCPGPHFDPHSVVVWQSPLGTVACTLHGQATHVDRTVLAPRCPYVVAFTWHCGSARARRVVAVLIKFWAWRRSFGLGRHGSGTRWPCLGSSGSLDASCGVARTHLGDRRVTRHHMGRLSPIRLDTLGRLPAVPLGTGPDLVPQPGLWAPGCPVSDTARHRAGLQFD